MQADGHSNDDIRTGEYQRWSYSVEMRSARSVGKALADVAADADVERARLSSMRNERDQ